MSKNKRAWQWSSEIKWETCPRCDTEMILLMEKNGSRVFLHTPEECDQFLVDRVFGELSAI